jgi:hypothetical protein
MKLDKDPFPANMNMVELEGKKVLVWLSQAEMTNGKRTRGTSCNIAQRSPLTSSWPSTRKAGPTSGGTKTRPYGIPNRTVQFPRVRPAALQPGARLTNDLGLCHAKSQKVGVIINNSIIRCLTSRSGHQYLSRGGLRRLCNHLVLLGQGGTVRGHHHQCTSIQDGQDLLRILATEASTQETVVMDTSTTNRTEGLQVRKTGQSRMLNWTIQFPRK